MDNFTQKFLEFEEENGLLTDTVNGFHYWGYTRYLVLNKIEDKLWTQRNEQKSVSRGPLSLVKDFIKDIPYLTIKNPFFRLKKSDIIFFSTPVRYFINGKYEDIYTDMISEKFDNVSVMEFPGFPYLHSEPVYTKKLFFLDYIVIPSTIYARSPFKGKPEAQLISKGKDIKNKIKQFFDIDLDERDIIYYFLYFYKTHKYINKSLYRLLKKVRPKVIVEVCHYDVCNFTINELANKLGIKTIELQHGNIGSGHAAYNYLVDRRYPFLPQKMFFFSDYWKKTCAFPIGEDNKYSVGYPYLEMQVNSFPLQTKEPNSSINVLFISQPTNNMSMISLAEQVLKIGKNNNVDFNITFKLHPKEYSDDMQKYNELLGYDNFELVADSKRNLYEILSQMDIQVGTSSTVIYEGLNYNLKTCILRNEESESVMNDLFKYGLVEKFETAEELFEKIKLYKREDITLGNKNIFFEEDSLNKMITAIRKILGEPFSANG